MISLGTKSNTLIPEAPLKKEVWYPSLHIPDISEELPLDEDALGDEVTARVKLKLTSISKNSNEKSKGKFSYSFDVLAIDIE
jgi:hypothetical protein